MLKDGREKDMAQRGWGATVSLAPAGATSFQEPLRGRPHNRADNNRRARFQQAFSPDLGPASSLNS